MKIENIRKFTYPDELSAAWKDEVISPLQDTKVQIRLHDDTMIEAGIFELIENGTKQIHACISSQAGCKFGCHFCKSGLNGFKRNLSKQEILDEISLLSSLSARPTFDHVVYMGIGEPLDNFENVTTSIQDLTKDKQYLNRVSLATIGIPESLRELESLKLPLRMVWVSLHAASDTKRAQLMPIGKTCKICDVVSAAKSFATNTLTQTWINYMIFQGFNDSIDDAQELTELLKGTENEIFVMLTIPNGHVPGYVPGNMRDVHRFQSCLQESGLQNKVARFFAAGRSVQAGCGEFVFHRR